MLSNGPGGPNGPPLSSFSTTAATLGVGATTPSNIAGPAILAAAGGVAAATASNGVEATAKKVEEAVKKDPSLRRCEGESFQNWLRRVCTSLGISTELSTDELRRLEMRESYTGHVLGAAAQNTQLKADEGTDAAMRGDAQRQSATANAIQQPFDLARSGGVAQRNPRADRLLDTTVPGTSALPLTGSRSPILAGQPISVK